MVYVQLHERSLKKNVAQKSNQNTNTGFQPQTPSTSVTLNPSINTTETTESICPTEVTGISSPTSSALIPGKKIPPQVHKKTIRTNSDIYNEPNTSSVILLVLLLISFIFKTLQTHHFLILIEPKGTYQCIIHLLIKITKF